MGSNSVVLFFPRFTLAMLGEESSTPPHSPSPLVKSSLSDNGVMIDCWEEQLLCEKVGQARVFCDKLPGSGVQVCWCVCVRVNARVCV